MDIFGFWPALVGLALVGAGAAYMFLRGKKGNDDYYARKFNDAWDLMFSKNVPQTMDKNSDGTFSFVFPNKDGVHYVTSPNPPVAYGKTITMYFRLEGEGSIVALSDNPGTARVRLFLGRKNDNLAMDGYRWWSKDAVDIPKSPQGDLVLTTKLDYANWSGLYGESADKDDQTKGWFDACLKDIAMAGFTFGAMFAGHGVYADKGNPKFVLVSYVIN